MKNRSEEGNHPLHLTSITSTREVIMAVLCDTIVL